MAKYLDDNGLTYLWNKIKSICVKEVTYDSSSKKLQETKWNGTAYATTDIVTLSTVATSGSYNDLSNKPTIPSAGTGSSYPAMDGTRALGSNAGYARVDHVHPTDTSRAPTNHAVSADTYGKGTSSNYGHVKLSDATDGTSAAASGGTAATPKAVADALTAANNYTVATIGDIRIDGVQTSGSVIHYGSCSTAASTTAKAVSVDGFNLITGAWVAVKFTVTNTGAVGSLTLNVNSTGAKSIKYRGNNLPSAGTLAANRVYFFVYDGTNYELIGDLDTNTTYTVTSPINLSGTTISHAVSGVTAAAKGDTSNQTPTWGGTFKALSGTVNDTGHLSAFAEHTVTIPSATASTTEAGLMAAADKVKLNGIAAGAEVNVQSNWTQTSTTADDYIKNKPTLGTAAALNSTTSIASGGGGLPTAGTVYTYVNNAISSAQTDAAVFKGIANNDDSSSSPSIKNLTNYKRGWYWVIGTAGTYAGEICEVGDMVFCVSNYGSAYSASDFSAVQSNIITITNAEIDAITAA